jgi:Zn-dependent peptidase ImmA (M78 family)
VTSLKQNVEEILEARGLDISELSKRTGIPLRELRSFLNNAEGRPETVVRKVARELLVPDFLLFANKLEIHNTSIPDFRLSDPEPGGYARETLRWIDFAESIQTLAKRIGANHLPRISDLIDADQPIEKTAHKLRVLLNFTDRTQLECADSRTMYALLRQRLESKFGIFILQLSFTESDGTGFSIVGRPYDVVVINTRNQAPARRAFTLGHEIYHCLVGRSGVSDSSYANNVTERRCNSFAANFLAPEDLVLQVARTTISSPNFDANELRAVSNRLNISMHASLLRLVELGVYRRTATSDWDEYVVELGDPDAPKKQKGGKPQDEWKNKLAKYGFGFARVFGAAKNSGLLDDLEFYRFSGIKPKFQASYLTNAVRARPQDAVGDSEENA